MPDDALGFIVPQGNVMRIDNALVEEVSFTGRNTGFVTVSYLVPRQGRPAAVEQLRLNVNNNTAVLNAFRMPIGLSNIRQGMWVDVTFSSRMTRSIPPQANAFSIVVRQPRRPSRPPVDVTTARILRVEPGNNALIASMPNNLSRITRYIVTDSTVILNRNGFPIGLRALRPGQIVQITHGNIQTPSLPPQTTAFRIQVI